MLSDHLPSYSLSKQSEVGQHPRHIPRHRGDARKTFMSTTSRERFLHFCSSTNRLHCFQAQRSNPGEIWDIYLYKKGANKKQRLGGGGGRGGGGGGGGHYCLSFKNLSTWAAWTFRRRIKAAGTRRAEGSFHVVTMGSTVFSRIHSARNGGPLNH